MAYRTYGYDNGRFYTYEPEQDDGRTYVPGRATNASNTSFGEPDAPGGYLSEWWGGPESSIEGVNPGQHGTLSPTDNQIGTGIASVMGGPSGISAIGKALRTPNQENVAAALGTLAVVGAGMAGMAGPAGMIAMLPAITGRLGLTGPTSKAVGPSTQSSNNAAADLGRMMPSNRVTTTPLTPPPQAPQSPAGAATNGPSAGPAAPAPSPAPGPGPAAGVSPDAGPGVGGGGVGVGGVGAPSAGAPAEGQSNAAASAAAAAAAAASGQAAAAAATAAAPAPDAAPAGTGPGAANAGSTSNAESVSPSETGPGPGQGGEGAEGESPATDATPSVDPASNPATAVSVAPTSTDPPGGEGTDTFRRGGRAYTRFKSKPGRQPIWHVKDAPEYVKFAGGGRVGMQRGTSSTWRPGARRPIKHPVSNEFPGIYDDPREIVRRAVERLAPEDPSMMQLFGVNRDMMWEKYKDRRGNVSGSSLITPVGPNFRGSEAVHNIMTPRNAQRMQDILVEGEHFPQLTRGAHVWYPMDPLYERAVEIGGEEAANRAYRRFNSITGMASPGSPVDVEIARGVPANTLANQGMFGKWFRYAGVPEKSRGADFPDDMRGVPGHMYHRTSHGLPMAKFLANNDEADMGSPKVPLYIGASGVPRLGFQTDWAVPDTHIAAGSGLVDARQLGTRMGVPIVQKGSMSLEETHTFDPWFRESVAAPLGIEAVPAQARTWTTLGPATGVKSDLGMTKLELVSRYITQRARDLGVDPEWLRDRMIMGKPPLRRGGRVTRE